MKKKGRRLDKREERKTLCTVRCVSIVEGVRVVPDRLSYARGVMHVMHDGRRVQQRFFEAARTNGVGRRCSSVLRVLSGVKHDADEEVLGPGEGI